MIQDIILLVNILRNTVTWGYIYMKLKVLKSFRNLEIYSEILKFISAKFRRRNFQVKDPPLRVLHLQTLV